MLGEGAVAEVGEVTMTEKGVRKRSVTIALLGGDTREPQIIRGKLVGELCALGDGLEPYTRVRFLGTYRLWQIDGKTYPVVTLAEIERVTVGSSRAEAAA